MGSQPSQHDGIQQLPGSSQGNPEAKQKRWAKRYRTEIAASASSILSTFAAVRFKPDCQSNLIDTDLHQFPLDSVKTRMQTYKYDNFTDCVRHTYQTEKYRGFFRGVTATPHNPPATTTANGFVGERSPRYVVRSCLLLS